MLSKQRSILKSKANLIDTIVHIGKNGITNNILKQTSDALDARELIKLKVQDSSPVSAREAANEISSLTSSEVVQVIGKRFIIYKRNKNKKVSKNA